MISIILECSFIVTFAFKLIFYLGNGCFFISKSVSINFKDKYFTLTLDKSSHPVSMLIWLEILLPKPHRVQSHKTDSVISF